MIICLAQIQSIKGDVAKNIQAHLEWVKIAAQHNVDLICFPELSLTGYEPTLATTLAIELNDSRLIELQQICDDSDIVICAGLPHKAKAGVGIGMVIFSPNKEREVYLKQILHKDEVPYFIPGSEQSYISLGEEIIAPAICYESMNEDHLKFAKSQDATIYLASVAKSKSGVDSALTYYPQVAQKYKIPILLCNAVGPSDTFISAGNSGVWDQDGRLVGGLNDVEEGLVIYNLSTRKTKIIRA